MTLIKTRIKILGRVQGVFYRHSTCQKARGLGLSGWVRNLPDGSVEAEIIGPSAEVEKLLSWCRSGPPAARVASVEIELQEELAESVTPNNRRFDVR